MDLDGQPLAGENVLGEQRKLGAVGEPDFADAFTGRRIERMLVESVNGYMQLPPGGNYVRAPALGANAGPLGAIALAMTAEI